MKNRCKIVFCFILLVYICPFNNLFSQEIFKISGTVSDSTTNEPIPGVLIQFKDTSLFGFTDSKGFFSLFVYQGKYSCLISSIGFRKNNFNVTVNKDITKDIKIVSIAQNLSELSITEKNEKNYTTEIGIHKMNSKEIEQLPKMLGESDPIKAIQLLPGIHSSGEGNSGFHVRGGGMDQNLFLVDDVSLYNLGHLFGFFSIFNSNVIENVSITKGSMPANYGGRLASVLDIKTKVGDLNQHKLKGGIGLLSSNLTMEGPIKKDTSSFIISARRTYIDAFNKSINQNTDYFQNFYFYDLNSKFYFKLNDKNRLYFTAYKGSDVFQYNDAKDNYYANKISWGNDFASLKWSCLLSEKLSMNIISSLSNYKMNFNAELFGYKLNLETKINDITNKIQFINIPNQKHTLKYGLEYTFHKIAPNNFKAGLKDKDFDFGNSLVLNSNEAVTYLNDDFKLNSKLSFSLGLRFSLFQQLGPFDRYILDESGKKTDTISYNKTESVKTYKYLEPRISVCYVINEQSSIKAGYTQNYQYIHLAPIASVSLPTDVWVPSSSIIKPQYGQQFSIGYFKNFSKKNIETSVEIYHKTMKNLLEYKEGILSVQNIMVNYDQNFFFGKGLSYGAEFFLKKHFGDFKGWVSYTLSKTMRSFEDIEAGRYYYAKHDRRHDLSLTGFYQINGKWNASAVFVYATGNAMTLPVSRYLIQGNIINTYSNRNSFRMPAYHRMDVSLTYIPRVKKRFNSEWNFSVYNCYNRKNPFYVLFETSGNTASYSLKVNIKKVSLFSIIPSVSYKFNF